LDRFVITYKVFYQSYAAKLTNEKIQELAHIISNVKWFVYVLTPIWYLIKFGIIAAVLATGDFLLNYKIGFRKLFQVAMVAETVFLIPQFIKLFWFLFFKQAESIQQVGSFEILSIYSLFKDQEIYEWLKFPFSLANIFELIYWLLLAQGIRYVTKFSYNKSLKFVLTTYCSGLLLWVVFIVFLSITMN
jgi:hypothetical protein